MSAETSRGATRASRQREMVRDQLAVSDAFRSAQSVFADLRSRGETVGLSTVYRHLQALADAGEVDTLASPDGEMRYRLCGPATGHHHHLVCRQCGLTVEIEGPTVERWTQRVAAEAGFQSVEHTIELQGLCAGCGARGAEPGR
jgi:Fur family ferric uptake transcriptional regulator